MKIANRQIQSLESTWSRAWKKLSAVLAPIKNDKELEQRNRILERVLQRIGDNESHPLAAFCDYLGRLIEEYEEKHFVFEDVPARSMLSFLMAQHKLKQKDLAHIIPQSNLSAVIRGKRALTLSQIAKLSAHFQVEPGVFIERIGKY